MSWWRGLPRRDQPLLLAALALAILVRVAYILATKDHTLAGDEPEYDIEARFFAGGDWFFSTTPFGDPHQTTWKAPGYGTFLGVLIAGTFWRLVLMHGLLAHNRHVRGFARAALSQF